MKKDMTRRQRTSAGAIRLKQTEDRDVHGHGKEKQERIRSRDNAQQTTGQMLPKGSRKTKLKVSNNVSNVKYTSKSKSKKAPKQHLQANTAFSPIKMEKNNESVATGGSAESLTENKRKRKRKRESEQGQYVKLKKQRESEQGQCVNLKKQRENEQGQCVNLKKQRESEQGQCVNLKQRDGLHTEWSAAQSSAEKVSGLTRKQRRSRKKNNSKKNKYKHLALASKDIVGGGGAETSITASSMVARIESRPTVHGNSMEFHSNTDTTVKQFTVKPSPVKQPAVKKFAQNALNSVQTPARVAASTTEQNAKLADSVFNSEKAKQKKSKLKLCDSPADANSSQSNWIGRAEPMSFIEKAREKLQAARFRFLNEQLYTSRGDQAWELFQTDPDAFHVYHQGFQTQASRWPLNPLDTIIQQLQSLPRTAVIADLGCGDGRLAEKFPKCTVHSFDLVATRPWITACDMANVPLESGQVDVAVFCLSLMGTNLADYLREANRVLRLGGVLKIVEVVSRFDGVHRFVSSVERLGFQLNQKLFLGKMFLLLSFKKVGEAAGKPSSSIHLKACHYKRR